MRESESPFSLTPLANTNGATSHLADRDRLACPEQHKAGRILLVDNEPHVSSLLADALEANDYDVKVVLTGSDAIQMLGRDNFDMVLTDIEVKDGSGIDLVDSLHRVQPYLPIVIVTAVRDVDVVVDSMRRGAHDYLLMPFDLEELLSAIKRGLNHGRALKDIHSYQRSLERDVQNRTEMLCRTTEDLEHSYDVTLEALGEALDLKDSGTEGHSKRVTAYTMVLARTMGISPAEVKIFARGAFLHDIGKMAIPDHILHKPSSLTPEEKALMREHCARGHDMLRKIQFLRQPAEIVLSHHEHYDGSGYPGGLSGASIPLGARVFAVADALDAITSDRPYRKARGFDVARENILSRSGTQFDPIVVDAFARISVEIWQELRSEIGI